MVRIDPGPGPWVEGTTMVIDDDAADDDDDDDDADDDDDDDADEDDDDGDSLVRWCLVTLCSTAEITARHAGT